MQIVPSSWTILLKLDGVNLKASRRKTFRDGQRRLEAVKSTPPIYLPLYIPFCAVVSGRGAQFAYSLVPSPISRWLREVAAPCHRRSILT